MNNLAKIFKALSDETRLKVLLLVSKRDICQKGISKYLGITDSSVSQHIKVLKEANIITGYKEGYYVFYHVNEQVFDECIIFFNSLENTNNNMLDISNINFNNTDCTKNCRSIKKCCKRKGI
jgi:ArsR family transcriptional regulator, arsenate/arsenite/antimonite-responsive transcriptional repressor